MKEVLERRRRRRRRERERERGKGLTYRRGAILAVCIRRVFTRVVQSASRCSASPAVGVVLSVCHSLIIVRVRRARRGRVDGRRRRGTLLLLFDFILPFDARPQLHVVRAATRPLRSSLLSLSLLSLSSLSLFFFLETLVESNTRFLQCRNHVLKSRPSTGSCVRQRERERRERT